MGLYDNTFAEAFTRLINKSGGTCYKIHQYSGLGESYLSRLKNGEKSNPSVETVMRISLALASQSNGKITLHHIEELFNSVGRSLYCNKNRPNI